MNIKPYEERKDTDKDTVYLRLSSSTTNNNDTIDLCIVDKDGYCVNSPIILCITKDMEARLIYTNNKLVSTDEDGKIKVIN